jgi:hypothetical protein
MRILTFEYSENSSGVIYSWGATNFKTKEEAIEAINKKAYPELKVIKEGFSWETKAEKGFTKKIILVSEETIEMFKAALPSLNDQQRSLYKRIIEIIEKQPII